MGIPDWTDIYGEIRTAIHAVLPAIDITAGGDDQDLFTSFQAVQKNLIELINLNGVNAPVSPYVFVQIGEFVPETEFVAMDGTSWRIPISLYYIDIAKNQTEIHAKLELVRAYFDNPAAAFTYFQVAEKGHVDASGENPVMQVFASAKRTTIRGGLVRWEPGWLYSD